MANAILKATGCGELLVPPAGRAFARRPSTPRPPLRSAFGVVALSVVAAACALGPATEPVPPGLGAPAQAKTITAAVRFPIIAFGPVGQTAQSGNMITWVELHSNGLATADEEGRPIPRLAAELPSLDNGAITVLDDGRVITRWSTRTDVTWHDGVPFTAKDIAFGVRVQSDPELPFADRSAVTIMDSIEALDDRTVLITWKRPYFLAVSLGPQTLLPLPAHLLEDEYNSGDKERFRNLPYWTDQYVHTGPFRLSRYEPGVEAVFKAYDGYFLGRPKIDTVTIKEFRDQNVVYAAVLSGEIDMTLLLFDADTATALKDQWQATGRGKVLTALAATFLLSPQFAPELVSPKDLLDLRIRRALYFGLDRQSLAELAYGGHANPEGEATSLLAPTNPLYAYVKDSLAGSTNDPSQAAQLFAGAGWTPGPDGLLVNAAGAHLSIEIRSLRETFGSAAASMWRQVGVDSSLSVPPPALAQSSEYNQSYQGAELTGVGAGVGVLDRFDRDYIPTAQNRYTGSNRGHYSDPLLNQLIRQFRSSLRPSEQGEAMRQISNRVAQELPVLPLFFNPGFGTLATGVQALHDFDGGTSNSFGLYTRSSHLWDKG